MPKLTQDAVGTSSAAEGRELSSIKLIALAVALLPFFAAIFPTQVMTFNAVLSVVTLLALEVVLYGLYHDRQIRIGLGQRVDALAAEDSDVREQLKVLTKVATQIRVFNSWQDEGIFSVIKKAKQSVILVDSWFDELSTFGAFVTKAAESSTNAEKLKVGIYQLDPEGGFGAQRLAESENRKRDDDDGRRHRGLYDEALKNIAASSLMKNPRLDVKCFKYNAMPCLRLMIIDGTDYIFSWFPGGTRSEANSCFLIPSTPVYPADVKVVADLKRQYEYIQSNASACS